MSSNFFQTELLQLTNDPKDKWTYEDAFKGYFISGGIGSGKTSGSGATLAKAFLYHGFGGLVLCAKPDEADAWYNYAVQTNRLNDFIFVRKGGEHRFNPLEYEWNRKSEGGGEVFNLTNLFMEIYKLGNRFGGGGDTAEKDRFWDSALRRAINRTIQLLDLAEREISVQNMMNVLGSIPTEQEMTAYINDEIDEDSFKSKSFCMKCLAEASITIDEQAEEGPEETFESKAEVFELVKHYFTLQMPYVHEKTRSTIVESFLGLAEPFTSGILRELFTKDSTIEPEVTHTGKVIVLDLPVKNYMQAGVYAQGIFKLLWQQAIERRKPESANIPNFLWVDESQLFLADYDQIFMTTARSSRTSVVYLTQNISNYYATLGGSNPKTRVDSLLGNFGTKIFHANNDAVHNEWASKVIGQAFRNVKNVSIGQNSRTGFSELFHWLVEPREFTSLKSGGDNNNKIVEAVITTSGKTWSNDMNFIITKFKQS